MARRRVGAAEVSVWALIGYNRFGVLIRQQFGYGVCTVTPDTTDEFSGCKIQSQGAHRASETVSLGRRAY